MSQKILLRKIISLTILITFCMAQISGGYAVGSSPTDNDAFLSQEASRYVFDTPGLMLLSVFQDFTLTGSIVEFLQMPAFLTEGLTSAPGNSNSTTKNYITSWKDYISYLGGEKTLPISTPPSSSPKDIDPSPLNSAPSDGGGSTSGGGYTGGGGGGGSSQPSDTTAPTITLSGASSMSIVIGSVYIEAGATCIDDRDTTCIVVLSGSVNTGSVGVYLIQYTATDASGNRSFVTRSVTITDIVVPPPPPKDTIAPIVTLIDASDITTPLGTPYTDSGAMWSDNLEGSGSSLSSTFTRSGSVDTERLGTYTLTYTKIDSDGNGGSATRTVRVIDSAAPVITLIGESFVTLEAGTPYTDSGAYWTDSVDGSGAVLDVTFTMTGTVDIHTLGRYMITYSKVDTSGNSALPVTRTIDVVDASAPIVTLVGSPEVIVAHGGLYDEDGAVWIDLIDGSGEIPSATSGSVNTLMVGDYTLEYSYRDTSGNIGSTSRIIHVVDMTPPEITLSGASTITQEVYTVFTDPGASCTDAVDTSCSVTLSGVVDISEVGTYTRTYTATDMMGNTSSRTRTIHIVDTTPPTISLSGSQSMIIEQGGDYIEPGYSCIDNYDVSCIVTISGSVDTIRGGVYIIEYSAEDISGNSAITQTRAITVMDSTSPSVALYGDTHIEIAHSLTGSYTDSGAFWMDSVDGSGETLDATFILVGNVDMTHLGTYTLTYTKTDTAGNTGSATRIVDVRDMTPPSVVLNGSSNITLEAGTAYTDAGASWNDIVDGSGSTYDATFLFSGAVDIYIPGIYTLTYTKTDIGGNITIVERRVEVVDTTPAMITLIGDADITLRQGSMYTELGASWSDTVDGSGEIPSATLGAVDTNTSDTYTLTYQYMDTSGNLASLSRVIHIIPRIPTADISTSMSSVHLSEPFILSWTSMDASSCVSSGDWSDSIGVSGSLEKNITSDATYTLTCQNSLGEVVNDSVSVTLLAPESPDAPSNVNGIGGDGNISLSWDAPVLATGSTIVDYMIEYKLATDVSWTVFPDGVSTSTTLVISGLENTRTYMIRVKSVTLWGDGPYSDPISVTPHESDIILDNGAIVETVCTTESLSGGSLDIIFSGVSLAPFTTPAMNVTYNYAKYLGYNTGGVISEDTGNLENNFPTRSVRASLNLPFSKKPRYTKLCTEYWPGGACKNDTAIYTPFNIDTYIDPLNATGTLENFYTHDEVEFYNEKNGNYTLDSSIQSLYLGESGSTDTAKDFGDALRAKNIEFLQIFFNNPNEYLQVCPGKTLDECAEINPAKMANFALYKATQVVYQAQYGIAPDYIELFNEPEGGWGVKVTPEQYVEFNTLFNNYLNELITYRLSIATGSLEVDALNKAAVAQVVGPGLGAADKLEFGKWFDAPSDATTFFSGIVSLGTEFSTHLYDGKRGVDPITALEGIVDFQNTYSTVENGPIHITEGAASTENSPYFDVYEAFCDSYCGIDELDRTGSYLTSQCATDTAYKNVCQLAKPDDEAFGFYSYPNCVADPLYTSSTFAPAVDMCYAQSSLLMRNTLGYINAGAKSTYLWNFAQNSDSSRHGFIVPDGTERNRTLMYDTIRDLYARLMENRYPYVPTYSGGTLTERTNSVAALFDDVSGSGRNIALTNIGTTPITYNITLPENMQRGRVTASRYTGGPSIDYRNMSSRVSTDAVTFGNSCHLRVTLPENSTLLLDIEKPVQKAERLKVIGKNVYLPDGQTKINLSGYNWGWWDTALEDDARENIRDSARVVRMPIRWYFAGTGSDIRDTASPGHIDPAGLAKLDEYIAWASENKLWVVLFGGSDEGAGGNDAHYWNTPELREEYFEMWEFLAERYKDTPYIAAYELLSEPHPPKPYTGADVRELYEELTTRIRAIDPDIPVIYGSNDHYDIRLMDEIYSTGTANVIYTFNFYEPTEYVKQTKGSGAVITYPSSYYSLKEEQVIDMDKEYLRSLLLNAVNFRDNHNVPIFNNQIGLKGDVPDALAYVKDTLSLMAEYDIGFTYWTYRVNGTVDDNGVYFQDKQTDLWGSRADWIKEIRKIFRRTE